MLELGRCLFEFLSSLLLRCPQLPHPLPSSLHVIPRKDLISKRRGAAANLRAGESRLGKGTDPRILLLQKHGGRTGAARNPGSQTRPLLFSHGWKPRRQATFLQQILPGRWEVWSLEGAPLSFRVIGRLGTKVPLDLSTSPPAPGCKTSKPLPGPEAAAFPLSPSKPTFLVFPQSFCFSSELTDPALALARTKTHTCRGGDLCARQCAGDRHNAASNVRKRQARIYQIESGKEVQRGEDPTTT